MSTWLCLDIDGVLNSLDDYNLITESLIKHNSDAADDRRFNTIQELSDRIMFYDTRISDYVNKADTERLVALQHKYGFKVLGISSWFGRAGNLPDDIGEFLGLRDVVVAPCTGGGMHRVIGIHRYLGSNSAIILDDQIEHYDMLPNNYKRVHPNNGMSDSDWLKLEEYLKLQSYDDTTTTE